MSLEQFNETFRDDIVNCRDMLLGLIDAFKAMTRTRTRGD